MNDRVQSALRVLGIGVPPVATLEREGAFFALLEDTLIYQDAGGTRRVTLRDLTRIHSDEEGLLRVETPAGTALTASLLGYDPARVQTFFAGVRDATARAKHLPTAPLPGLSGQKTFGTPPASPPTPKPPASAPASPPSSAPPPREAAPKGPPTPGKASSPDPRAGQSDPAPSRSTRWKPPGQNDLGGETVRVIGPSARAQTPTPVPPPAPTASPEAAPARVVVSPVPVKPEVTSAPPVQPAPAESAPVRPGPVRLGSVDSSPVTSSPVTPGPVTPSPVTSSLAEPVPAAIRTGQGLEARAEGVQGWVGRLRLLAAVLGLAALGLAAFQFVGGTRLTGLWTLIVGGVGALALLAFAEVTELVVALARAVAGDGAADPERSISNDPGT